MLVNDERDSFVGRSVPCHSVYSCSGPFGLRSSLHLESLVSAGLCWLTTTTITGRPRLGRSLWSSAMAVLSCTFVVSCWSADCKTGNWHCEAGTLGASPRGRCKPTFEPHQRSHAAIASIRRRLRVGRFGLAEG